MSFGCTHMAGSEGTYGVCGTGRSRVQLCLLIEVMIATVDVLGAAGIWKALAVGDWMNDTSGCFVTIYQL